MGSIGAALGSLKAAGEIAKSLIDLHDATKINSKVIELQSVILSAQSGALDAQAAQRTLLDRIGELEEEMARMEAWDAEKQKYELAERVPGESIFAYRLKEDTKGTEPPHWICATCYERGTKSILQKQPAVGRRTGHHCPACKTTLETRN